VGVGVSTTSQKPGQLSLITGPRLVCSQFSFTYILVPHRLLSAGVGASVAGVGEGVGCGVERATHELHSAAQEEVVGSRTKSPTLVVSRQDSRE
jgi:hypothetical protein